jgi:tetrahydromethanopterin S-methyltransferase subunit F
MLIVQRSDNKLYSGILKAQSRIVGLALGAICGLVIFLATNWLLLKGGHYNAEGEYLVGPHLELLSQFFPGYSVSFLGSCVGFAYGFVFGVLAGTAMGWIYNTVVDFRSGRQ